MIWHMKMPPLYVCEVCGHALDLNSNVVIRQANVWLKGKGRTVHSVISEDFRYIHEFCHGVDKNKEPKLF
jgi:hypothetical protein